MCYAKPGPRCSYHTRAEGERAMRDLRAAWDDPKADTQTINDLHEKAEEAQRAYARTPRGIALLRRQGKNDLADAYDAERNAQLAEYHASLGVARDEAVYIESEDLSEGMQVVHRGEVRTVESIYMSTASKHQTVKFTDGSSFSSENRGDAGSLMTLATPDGKIPVAKRDLQHRQLLSAAVAHMGGKKPEGDSVVVYGVNARGQSFAAVVKGPQARGKNSHRMAQMISSEVDKLGDGASVYVMSTDADMTNAKRQRVHDFNMSIHSARRTSAGDVQTFYDMR